jgi:hypothetical protein
LRVHGRAGSLYDALDEYTAENVLQVDTGSLRQTTRFGAMPQMLFLSLQVYQSIPVVASWLRLLTCARS